MKLQFLGIVHCNRLALYSLELYNVQDISVHKMWRGSREEAGLGEERLSLIWDEEMARGAAESPMCLIPVTSDFLITQNVSMRDSCNLPVPGSTGGVTDAGDERDG